MSAWDILYFLTLGLCMAIIVAALAILLSVGRTFIESTDDDPFSDRDDRCRR